MSYDIFYKGGRDVGAVTNFIKHAWQTFSEDRENPPLPASPSFHFGPSSSTRPDRLRLRVNSERTIIASIYTRLAVDVAGIKIEHCRLNDDGQYEETMISGLNECLNVKANTDQAGRFIRQDMASTLFQEGTVAIVPVKTSKDPRFSDSWDIQELRIGTIVNWKPLDVQVRVYNDKTGQQEDIWLPKSMVAIAENPFYSIMNEPNSTLQRLIRKLNMLDHVDEISSSGKLDIIIQLPYVVKTDTMQQQAEKRRKELQDQLQGSMYGIAYADGTEKITQLNRSVENNLLAQVQYLKEEVLSELGLSKQVMDGTATDAEMLNYRNRILEPVLDALVESMIMTFLSKTARSQKQSILYFEQPFKLLPISAIADVIDSLSRNQIVTPNEVRPALGLKPSKEPQANQLINSNMPLKDQITGGDVDDLEEEPDEDDLAEAELDRKMADLGIG